MLKSTYTVVDTSVVDRHLVASDPGPTFHFDADPDPDPTPGFIHRNASLQGLIFFITVIGVIILAFYPTY